MLPRVRAIAAAGLLALAVASRTTTGSAQQAAAETGLPSFAEPAISPDGREIAFVSGGDIWTVPATGGDARLLVSHAANESRPQWAPDGRRLAFVSTRTGGGDLYVLALETGEVSRLTWDDAAEVLDGWSADGEWVYFSSTSRDIAGMNDVFRVRAAGGTPMPVSSDRYVSEFFSAPAPDGRRVALSARGIAAAQWWRNGHSHIDQSELWILEDGKYTKVVDRGAKALWPMWAAERLYFMSDREGAENIWSIVPGGSAARVTQFKDGRVLWPSISRDGKTIAFERNFGIWTLNTATAQGAEVRIRRIGAPASTTVDRLRLTNQIIYTSNTRLIDGSVLRLPRIRITAMDGFDMEMKPRPVDVPVTRPLGESFAGRDSQLDAAVRVLLEQLDTRRTTAQ